jgi:hypothetical protein
VAEFEYFGMIVRNENYVYEGIKSRLIWGMLAKVQFRIAV